MANDNYTIFIKQEIPSFYNHFQGNFLRRFGFAKEDKACNRCRLGLYLYFLSIFERIDK